MQADLMSAILAREEQLHDIIAFEEPVLQAQKVLHRR